MSNDTYRILFCGTGGQGVLSASEVCGVAALLSGYHVRKSEVHGMAQRGGSVESHLLFGDRVYSPLIRPGYAGFLVCFDAEEARRLRHFLTGGGVDFTPFLAEASELPDKRFVNTFLLGVLAAMLPIEPVHWIDAIRGVIGKRIDENTAVFIRGMERGKLRA
jgi:indolepyruvate ferredoxin oxidoreductase beta subunit